MAKLTKYEKETIILFNEGEDTASIYTFNAGLKKRLALFAKKYPDLCRQEKTYEQGGRHRSRTTAKEAGKGQAVKMSCLYSMF